MRPINWILIIVLLGALSAGAWWSARQRNTTQQQTTQEQSDALPDGESNKDNTNAKGSSSAMNGQSNTSISVTTNGNTAYSASITLKDANGGRNLGTATRTYDGLTFVQILKVQLESLNTDEYYEGWISKENNSGFIPAGRLTLLGDEWTLTFTATSDLRMHTKVSVSKESAEQPDLAHPTRIILEGVFDSTKQ